jgi:hypothetical protein
MVPKVLEVSSYVSWNLAMVVVDQDTGDDQVHVS